MILRGSMRITLYEGAVLHMPMYGSCLVVVPLGVACSVIINKSHERKMGSILSVFLLLNHERPHTMFRARSTVISDSFISSNRRVDELHCGASRWRSVRGVRFFRTCKSAYVYTMVHAPRAV